MKTRREILKLNESRKHKVTNSLGVYDAYKWIRKNKWLDIGRPLKEGEFYKIIRGVNKLLSDNLVNGIDVKLPHRMGELSIRKTPTHVTFENGKLINNLPIDWDKTLSLWEQDEEAYNNKQLVKILEKEVFRVYYDKSKANYNNKIFYQFLSNRNIKLRLKLNILKGNVDAFLLSKYYK